MFNLKFIDMGEIILGSLMADFIFLVLVVLAVGLTVFGLYKKNQESLTTFTNKVKEAFSNVNDFMEKVKELIDKLSIFKKAKVVKTTKGVSVRFEESEV